MIPYIAFTILLMSLIAAAAVMVITGHPWFAFLFFLAFSGASIGGKQ